MTCQSFQTSCNLKHFRIIQLLGFSTLNRVRSDHESDIMSYNHVSNHQVYSEEEGNPTLHFPKIPSFRVGPSGGRRPASGGLNSGGRRWNSVSWTLGRSASAAPSVSTRVRGLVVEKCVAADGRSARSSTVRRPRQGQVRGPKAPRTTTSATDRAIQLLPIRKGYTTRLHAPSI